MNKTKIAIAALAASVSVLGVISYFGSEHAIMQKFPDIAKSDVRTAHRKMVLAALKGDFKNVDMNDDNVMSNIFLSFVNNL